MVFLTACSGKKGGSAPQQSTAPTPDPVSTPTPTPTPSPTPTPTPADTTPPLSPVITAPGNNPLNSNSSSVTLSGTCETGAAVQLSGASSASQTCVSSGFSFSLSKSSDGSYSYTLSQTDPAGNVSPSAAFQWNRDTVAPAAPTVTVPSANPYTSSDTNVTISGACENGATVFVSGAVTDSVVCASGAYSFAVSKSVDGTYNFSLTQKDVAGNTSPAKSFQWVRDTGVPATPVINSPSAAIYYSNGSALTIAGTCTTGYTVLLSGDGSDAMTCASGAFSFVTNKTSDGTYNYSVLQKSLANNSSASASVSWVRDTVAPAALSLTSPTTTPVVNSASTLTLAGACEAGATIYVTGSATANSSCSSGSFSINVNKSTDGNFSFSLAQTDLAGNSSTATAVNWTRDTTAPAVPTIVSPTSPYISNTSSVVITGGCESQATVSLSGSATDSVVCVLSNYSFTVPKSSDGNYSFNIGQTDLAGNNSTAVSFAWQRDTVAPAAVTIVSPGSNPFTSSDTNLSISGACENGASVSLAGASTQTAVCASNSYSFPISKSVDATYNYTLSQVDPAGNASANTSFSWIRNSVVPNTPTITTPAVATYSSNLSALTISGACDTGNTVELGGAGSSSIACSAGTYSFSVTKSTDGTYDFTVLQKSPSNISSASASLRWIRDTVAPSAPTVTAPSTTPKYTNGNSLTVSGACENGATVSVSGAATSSVACTSGSYSFSLSKVVDGTFNFSISQKDPALNVSASTAITWVRDTVAPAKPSLISPTTNPFASGDTNITLNANCEPGAAVAMSGDGTGTATCSALGQVSFNISKSIDGTYNFSVVQTDLAGNSSVSLDFQWIRDTSVPFTPVITAPAGNPYRSNQNTVTIKATCDPTLTPASAVVELSGDIDDTEVTSPAGSLSQNCTSSPVTFVIQKSTDGVYDISVSQDNPTAGTSSATADLQWILDTVAPSVVTVTSPASNPFVAPGNLTLSGACEANATVYLTGADTQNAVCSVGGVYSFNVTKTTDAVYNFVLKQTDLAGNSSSNKSFQWTRDSNSVPPPTITSPSLNPEISNDDALVISGACNTGYLVTLSGDVTAAEVTTPSHSLTQTCAGGSYSYEIAESTDGNRNFSLKQTFNAVDSSAATTQWVRDTVAPVASFSSTPLNPNLVTSASFAFSSNESGSVFECKMDSGSFATCASPVAYATVTNGNHTFYVHAIDKAGNVSSNVSFAWVQAAYNAVALYHLDTASPLADSSLFTVNSVVNQALTSTGTTTDVTGKFSNARSFGSSIYLSTPSTAVLNSAVNTMTVEGFVKISSSISTTGNYYTLVAKNGVSPQLGWEIRLRKASSSKYAVDFVYSLDGTTAATTVSTSTFSISTGTFYYFAVTWNKGQTKIYFNSTSAKISKGSVGTSKLFASTSPLTLGKGATTGTGTALWLSGVLDEVRISQTVRTISIPSAAFTAD